MTFKENLLTKIRIDKLTQEVSRSLGTQAGPHKIDKDAMRKLLSLSPYGVERLRDLELYVRPLDGDHQEILVLDNELPLYTKTTVQDVTLRRSPELKEMISIRNIIKILNDSDIRLSKGQASVQHVSRLCLESLDLRYEKADVDQLVEEAKGAFLTGDADALLETLYLFVEMMGYRFVPAEFAVNDHAIFGPCHHGRETPPVFDYVILYNERANELKLINHRLQGGDPGAQELVLNVAQGTIAPDLEAVQVLGFLADEAMKKKGPTIH